MTKYWFAGMAVSCALVVASISAVDSAAKSPPPSTETAQIVQAASSFLATLDAKQRQSVLYAFDNEQQRARWSNLPTGFIPRGGISLRQMTPAQRAAAMNLLAVALSKRGYEKVQQIMEGDEVNKKTDTGPPGAGNRGNRPPRGNGGPPPGPLPMARGLHLVDLAVSAATCSARISITSPSLERPRKRPPGCCSSAAIIWRSTSPSPASQGVLTPTLTGAQPALYTDDGKTVRPLGQESDKALALLNVAGRQAAEAGDAELRAGRSGARPRTGRQDRFSPKD